MTSVQDPLIPDEDPEYSVHFPTFALETVCICGIPLTYRRKDTATLLVYALGSFLSLVLVFCITAWCLMAPPIAAQPRGVILMISDGFGPASQTMARNFAQYSGNLSASFQMPLDTILVGSSRTRSSSSLVTDSAAGATAFSCALKSYNGAIAVDPQGRACGTVLEAAKALGMVTALVATSRITHATPAAFASHVSTRLAESDIAVQMVGNNSLGRQVDLLFGGGSCYFRPVPHPQSCRSDSVDVFQMAQNIGWNVIDKQQFDEISLDTKLPLMSLFAPDMMAYDIDRDPVVEPSLTEMASTALRLVNKASKERSTGFFIMIEGSRIDMAAHSNDPAAHLRDILEYNRAVAAVKKFVDQNPDTVMISVSDHETGGFTVASSADPQYIWYPEMLAPVKHSGEYIAREILSTTAANKATHVRNSVLKSYLGISNPDESDILFLSSQTATFEDLDRRIGAISARRANLGFTTHGHTAVDVNLYAYGVNSHLLRGNRENTEIGDFIKKSLRLDLDYITQKLNLDLGETPLDPDYPNTHH